MNKKLYLVDFGFLEDTVVYELKPVEVARIERATLSETLEKLTALDVHHVVVDKGFPEHVDHLICEGYNVIAARLPQV